MAGAQYPWYLLALIPLISSTIGWVTNVLAVKMMFYPAEFVGVKPIGWQGLVPANAVRLARALHELISTKLLRLKEVFSEEEVDEILEEGEERLRAKTSEAIEKMAATHFKDMWDSLPESGRTMVIETAFSQVKGLSRDLLRRLVDDVETLIDLEGMVMEAARTRRKLMARIFSEVGKDEFRFIERSGLYFGFLFGLVQLGIWIFYPAWWVLPFFGFMVGYATNWVALKLVFEPREPKRVLGLELQGLFHKRQNQVAADFSAMVTEHVLTDEALFEQMTRDASRARILEAVREEASKVMVTYRENPLIATMVSDNLAEQIEEAAMAEIEAELLRPDGMLGAIAAKSKAIRETLKRRLASLDPKPFEGVLRPAFQQDEWKLIIAGAALGLGAGTLQLIYIFGEALAGK